MDGNGRTIEVCREFLHDRCKRSADECKFAHPPPHIDISNGWVTCCVDSLRDKCKRDDPPCRYLHPPQHLKERLLMVGRNLRNSNSYRGGFEGSGGGGGFRGSAGSRGGDAFRDDFASINPFFNTMSGLQEFLGTHAEGRKGSWMDSQDRYLKSNAIEVCREFMRGRCNRDLEDCRFAHPPSHLSTGSDNMVTVCMDFVRGYCSRETCRYFHPPPHLQSRIKSGASSGSSSRKRSFPSGYRNGDDLEYKRHAPDDFYS